MAKYRSWHDSYETIDELGEGGNAKVYRVKNKDNDQEFALKDLIVGGTEKHGRFVDEINVMKDNCTKIKGIIPIIDFSISEYWYTMPIAKSAIDYIIENEFSVEDIVVGTIQLCETLEKLHEKGVSHRDIKPSNIYHYENTFCFGDFGLVDFLDNPNDYTKSDKGLGAIFTIAPEMKRNPKKADGKKADVFSLSKTLWMLLSGDEKGFDGVYNYLDSSHSLRYIEKYRDTHLVELDELLKDATDNNPDIRPTIKVFKERLTNWVDICSDVNKSQASDWNFLTKQLFGPSMPESSTWIKIDKIIEILNVIGNTTAYNHMLFSGTGGGLDFSHIELAKEENCVYLYDTLGYCHTIKPKFLHFGGFDEHYKWNYFLLELDELEPIFEGNYGEHEYLVEDIPAHYVSAEFAQYGVYEYDTGVPLPAGYKTVYRYTKGKFLIVMKTGPYNGINGTYDGRHGDCSADEFRDYISSLIKLYEKVYFYAKQQDTLKQLTDDEIERRFLLLKKVNENPFKTKLRPMDNTMEIKEELENQKKSKDYIHQNFKSWNFSDLLKNYLSTDPSTIKFVFEFKSPNSSFSLESYEGICNYVCTDGKIKKLRSCLDENCYCVYDRKIAIDINDKLEKKVSEILNENSLIELVEDEACFSIELVRVGKPTHLFSKQEIEKVMRQADDRKHNMLVIDENGYAKVIDDMNCRFLYPVRHESWDAGNMYVGKYSGLETLDDDYISSLQGWLMYLQSGRSMHMDYVHENTNEDELIKSIREYY